MCSSNNCSAAIHAAACRLLWVRDLLRHGHDVAAWHHAQIVGKAHYLQRLEYLQSDSHACMGCWHEQEHHGGQLTTKCCRVQSSSSQDMASWLVTLRWCTTDISTVISCRSMPCSTCCTLCSQEGKTQHHQLLACRAIASLPYQSSSNHTRPSSLRIPDLL